MIKGSARPCRVIGFFSDAGSGKRRASRIFGGLDRGAHLEIVTGESPRFGRGQTVSLEPGHQLLLARQHASAKAVQVEPRRSRLGEHPFRPLLFFVDMVFDLFGENLDLGVIEFLVGTASLNLGDKHLGAVVLDIGFPNQIIFDLALACGIEDSSSKMVCTVSSVQICLARCFFLSASPAASNLANRSSTLR
jgi:hypothetical protein